MTTNSLNENYLNSEVSFYSHKIYFAMLSHSMLSPGPMALACTDVPFGISTIPTILVGLYCTDFHALVAVTITIHTADQLCQADQSEDGSAGR